MNRTAILAAVSGAALLSACTPTQAASPDIMTPRDSKPRIEQTALQTEALKAIVQSMPARVHAVRVEPHGKSERWVIVLDISEQTNTPKSALEVAFMIDKGADRATLLKAVAALSEKVQRDFQALDSGQDIAPGKFNIEIKP